MKDFLSPLYAMYLSMKASVGLLFFNLCIKDRQDTKALYECALTEKEVQDAFPLVLSAIASLFILNRIFSSNYDACDKDLARSFIEKHKDALKDIPTEELSSFLKGAEHTDSLLGRLSDCFDLSTWRHPHKYYQGRACDNTKQFTTIIDVKRELGTRLQA